MKSGRPPVFFCFFKDGFLIGCIVFVKYLFKLLDRWHSLGHSDPIRLLPCDRHHHHQIVDGYIEMRLIFQILTMSVMMSERIAFQSYQRATGPLKQLSSFHTGDPIMLFTKFVLKTVIILYLMCFCWEPSVSNTGVYQPWQRQGPWSLSITLETD